MKKITVLLLSLLVATQAFALGKNERNALLGFGAGVLVTHLIQEHSKNNAHTRVSYNENMKHARTIQRTQHHAQKPRFAREHKRAHRCHKDKRFHKRYSKHHKKKHHKRAFHRQAPRENIVVVNRYRNHYYN